MKEASSKARRAETAPSIPLPTPDQLEPFHFAIRFAGTPPAVVNVPPAKSARPLPSLKPLRVSTKPFIPLPSADQLEPSHLAIRFTNRFAMAPNSPPA